MKCCVCDALGTALELDLPAPGITSMTTTIDAPTQVYVCEQCAHAQSPEPANLEEFYDTEYRISLQSDDFDQVYEVIDGKPVYRIDRQLNLLLGMTGPLEGKRVLDYGAGKGQSLQRLIELRPGFAAHIFDVSQDYRDYWGRHLPGAVQATFEIPPEWQGSFDLVTAYFVLEHVADPAAHLARLRSLLSPRGQLFVIVPSPLTNSGDLLVIDHVQHFTPPSLRTAFARAGLEVKAFDSTGFRGAIAALVERTEPDPMAVHTPEVPETLAEVRRACREWSAIDKSLHEFAGLHTDQIVAVHGAGFYGSLVMHRLKDVENVKYVLDNNPHMNGAEFFGRTIRPSASLPADADLVIAALNPLVARNIVGDGRIYGERQVAVHFLEGAASGQ